MRTTVVGLYVHGPAGTRPDATTPTPMLAIDSVDAVEGTGLRQDPRYFRRPPDAHERKRQVSLIDEATIWRHEAEFGPIAREFVKSQIVLEGDVRLPDFIGSSLTFQQGAEMELALTRVPCYAMDLIYPGLRQAMANGKQGALARITVSGVVAIGDAVEIAVRSEIAVPA